MSLTCPSTLVTVVIETVPCVLANIVIKSNFTVISETLEMLAKKKPVEA